MPSPGIPSLPAGPGVQIPALSSLRLCPSATMVRSWSFGVSDLRLVLGRKKTTTAKCRTRSRHQTVSGTNEVRFPKHARARALLLAQCWGNPPNVDTHVALGSRLGRCERSRLSATTCSGYLHGYVVSQQLTGWSGRIKVNAGG